MKKRLLQLIAILLAGGIQVCAQQFSVSADRTVVGQNERFQVYFTMSNADLNKISNFKAPDFRGLHVLSGPNQSTSMQIINGKTDSQLQLSYLVYASEVGEITLGSASINYNGKTYTTQPVKIKVEKASPQVQQQNQGNSSASVEKELAKGIFIAAEADRKSVTVGQQVLVTYKLYTKYDVSGLEASKLPVYQGCWTEEVDVKNIMFEYAMHNNERFRVAVIKKAALFPTKTGTLSVTPFELKVPVQIKKKKNGNDIFDDFFNDPFFGTTETIQYNIKSNALQINVTPLPQQGAPASFNGAVGSFTLNSELDKKDLKTNESATLRVTISSSGNIKLLTPPELKAPGSFEKYEPKVVENIVRSGSISGQKIIDYLVIPRAPGDFEIPPMEFSYYNDRERRYVTLKTPLYNLHVEKGEGYVENSGGVTSKETVQLLNEDIRYIKSSNFSMEKRSSSSAIKWWFWTGILLSLICFASVLVFSKRREKLQSDVRLLRFKKAEKMAVKKLELAKEALAKNNVAGFYEETSKALFGYLEDKLSIEKSNFTLDLVLKELNRLEVRAELISKVKELAELCEFARFAPQQAGDKTGTDIYKEAVTLITALENSFDLRKKK